MADEVTSGDDAIVAMKTFSSLEKEAKQFWKQLDDIILKPRIDLPNYTLRSKHINKV
jgi:hypothetical protein